MKQYFDKSDYAVRICSIDEIGAPWEDRFSSIDVFEKRCTEFCVGILKAHIDNPLSFSGFAVPDDANDIDATDAPDPSDQYELDDATVLALCRERGIDPLDAVAKANIMLEIAPVKLAQKNLPLFMALRQAQKDEEKLAAAKAQSIDNLTEKRLAPLSGDEWARAVVHAFASAPEDCRHYLRRELMLTDEFIEQHLQE